MESVDRLGRERFLAEAEALFADDNLQAAEELAAARLEWKPDDLPARVLTCRVQIRQGRLDEAREILQGIEEDLATLVTLYIPFAELCLARGLDREAASCYEKFIRLNPGTPEAAAVAERLHEIGSRDGNSATEVGEPETVETGEVPPDFQTVTLAELYIRQGHLTQAVDLLEAILRRDPGQAGAARRLEEIRKGLERPGASPDSASIAAELSRWLQNIGRLRTHAA